MPAPATHAWLNYARARRVAIVLAVAQVAALVLLVATARSGFDRLGAVLGTDFLSFWAEGRLLANGGAPYDAAAHAAVQDAAFPGHRGYVAFFYPPLFLAICRALGTFDYFPALAIWLAAGLSAYALAVRAWFRALLPAERPWLWIAAFPPVFLALTHGQTALLVAALLGGGLLLVRSRPWLGGVLLGLAAIKPQFGLLVPIALLLTGQWRAIAGAVLSAGALAGAVTLWLGPIVWASWLGGLRAGNGALASGAIGFEKVQSVFAAARIVGLTDLAANAVQAIVALAVIAALAIASWRREFGPQLAAATLAGTVLVTPFVLDYDYVLLAFPLVAVLAGPLRRGDGMIAAAVFVLPLAARGLAGLGLPLLPFAAALLFAAAIRRALSPRTSPEPG